jgi:hypothetical protein
MDDAFSVLARTVPHARSIVVALPKAWGNPTGSGGFGRSNLVSEVEVIDSGGKLMANSPVADAFLSGWKPDGTDLVCYRDGEYSLVSMDGKHSSIGGRTTLLDQSQLLHLLFERSRNIGRRLHRLSPVRISALAIPAWQNE